MELENEADVPQDAVADTVYVRAVAVSELPKDVREQADGLEQIYAVHAEDGERLALVRDRSLAFIVARQNHMEPVSVH